MRDTIEDCCREIDEYIAAFWMTEPVDVHWGETESYKLNGYDNLDIHDADVLFNILKKKYDYILKLTFCFRKDSLQDDLWQIIAERRTT